jgi:hypothetical protein
MGGRVVTEAISRVEVPFESTTLVASAGYIKEQVSYLEATMHFIATTPETTSLALRHPIHALHVGTAAMSNCIRRYRAVAAELYELTNEPIHEEIYSIKENPHAPYIRFLYGDRDYLLPANLQRNGVQGLPIDQVASYRGGHLRLVDDPSLSRDIYQQDNELLLLYPHLDPEEFSIAA